MCYFQGDLNHLEQNPYTYRWLKNFTESKKWAMFFYTLRISQELNWAVGMENILLYCHNDEGLMMNMWMDNDIWPICIYTALFTLLITHLFSCLLYFFLSSAFIICIRCRVIHPGHRYGSVQKVTDGPRVRGIIWVREWVREYVR